MAKSLKFTLLSCILISLFVASSAQTCKTYKFSSNKLFSSCKDLPVLNSFIHWNLNSSSGSVQIAYRQINVDSSKWVAWAINPSSTGMQGSQALVAFQQSDGTTKVYTSPVNSYGTSLAEGKLSFDVSELSATFANKEITIFATLVLPNNSTNVNQVWQFGSLSGSTPLPHSTTGANVQSMATLDFLSGQSAGAGGGGGGGVNSKIRKRNVHGVMNAVSWGIMMPVGALIARYLKVSRSADPAWFYLHVGCQTSAYIVGVAGWALGLKLGSDSPGIEFKGHRNIGIILFCLGTLQVFALLLRPNKDHKFRFHWNIYHHVVGYTVIVLSVINIYKGFDILDPEKKWKRAYTAVIVILVLVAVFLEVLTWFIVLKRKKMAEKMPPGTNGSTGFNGNGARQRATA